MSLPRPPDRSETCWWNVSYCFTEVIQYQNFRSSVRCTILPSIASFQVSEKGFGYLYLWIYRGWRKLVRLSKRQTYTHKSTRDLHSSCIKRPCLVVALTNTASGSRCRSSIVGVDIGDASPARFRHGGSSLNDAAPSYIPLLYCDCVCSPASPAERYAKLEERELAMLPMGSRTVPEESQGENGSRNSCDGHKAKSRQATKWAKNDE